MRSGLESNPDRSRISVVTPSLRRPEEVRELLQSLARQTLPPREFILVDGAPEGENETRDLAAREFPTIPFPCRYIRHGGGTAIQRNIGIQASTGELIALIDDDIRLDCDFLETMSQVYQRDEGKAIGGVVGYRTNEYFDPPTRGRWRWYRRLRLLTTYEPGRYDYLSGYPINANMQPPFSGCREVDFMTTACAVWRRDVFDAGLSFDPFFRGYGILEDAHFSLRAKRRWRLYQCGDARCQHFPSPRGRAGHRKVGYMHVVNYYYVFRDIAGPLQLSQRLRFWSFQVFELFRMGASFVSRRRRSDLDEVLGRLDGMLAVLTRSAWKR